MKFSKPGKLLKLHAYLAGMGARDRACGQFLHPYADCMTWGAKAFFHLTFLLQGQRAFNEHIAAEHLTRVVRSLRYATCAVWPLSFGALWCSAPQWIPHATNPYARWMTSLMAWTALVAAYGLMVQVHQGWMRDERKEKQDARRDRLLKKLDGEAQDNAWLWRLLSISERRDFVLDVLMVLSQAKACERARSVWEGAYLEGHVYPSPSPSRPRTRL